MSTHNVSIPKSTIELSLQPFFTWSGYFTLLCVLEGEIHVKMG